MTQQPLHIGYRLLETERDKGEFQNIFKSVSKRRLYKEQVFYLRVLEGHVISKLIFCVFLDSCTKNKEIVELLHISAKVNANFFSDLPIYLFIAADYKDVLT